MLDDKKIEQLTERVVNRIAKANTRVLEAIGKQINRIGKLTPSKAQDLINILKYGGKYEEIVKELSKITGENIRDIKKIFELTAKKNLNFSKKFYDYRNEPFIPYEDNKYIKDITKEYTKQAVDSYMNLSKTLGFVKTVNGKTVYSSIRDTYLEAIDEAVLNVRTGQGFTTAMKDTVERLAESGIRTVDYDSGYSRRLDSSVRQNIQDGIVGMHNSMQQIIGEETGADGVEISHHLNSAPDHIDTVDGRQFKIKEFEELELKRPVGTMNCRHLIYYIILDITPPRWSKEELARDKALNEKGFEYKGRHYTNYEGTQLQRRIETEVRRQRDVIAMGNSEASNKAEQKISDLMQEYKAVNKISGLSTRMERLRTVDFKGTIDIPPEVIELKYNSLEEAYKKVDLRNIDKDYADKIGQELLDLQNDYPIGGGIEVTSRVDSGAFGYNKTNIVQRRKQGTNWAVYNHNINFSSKYMRDAEISDRMHKADFKDKGSKLVDNKTGLTTVGHEYAHAIDYRYTIAKRDDFKEMIETYKERQPLNYSNAVEINKFNHDLTYTDESLANTVWNRMKEDRGIKYDYEFNKLVREELGTYASSDIKEFLAEGFSNMRYLEDEFKTDFIRDFEKIFNEEFKEVLGNASDKQ